jgi:hypothetical protein
MGGRALRRGGVLAGALAKAAERVARAADGEPLLLGRENAATGTTVLTHEAFGLDAALQVTNGPGRGGEGPGVIATGSVGVRGGTGVIGTGGRHIVGLAPQGGTGVIGHGGEGPFVGGTGVLGVGGRNDAGLTKGGTGVIGIGVRIGVEATGDSFGVTATSLSADSTGVAATGRGNGSTGVAAEGGRVGVQATGGLVGVQATARDAVSTGLAASGGTNGVQATGGTGLLAIGRHTGVFAHTADSAGAGIVGLNTTGGAGMVGSSLTTGPGVHGESPAGAGVVGRSTTGTGVWATCPEGIALYATSAHYLAARFDGQVEVNGRLVVNGDLAVLGAPAVATAAAAPDGSLRRLYALASPEGWVEDFGAGQLTGGAAQVRLDPEFAALVRGDAYHVFLTPGGDSRGLYVANKGPTGFAVQEQQGGTGSLPFGYRVVAKRREAPGPRLERVPPRPARQAPPAPAPPRLPEVPPLPELPPLPDMPGVPEVPGVPPGPRRGG